ncbi:MAG: VanZ family protein [Glaciimonas sp.]|nr:VanZ family protein [Glaciimonas sp.]
MHWSVTHLLFGDRYKTFRFRAAFVLYVLIVVLGSIPGARADVGRVASGLVLHGLAYSIITFLLFTGSNGHPTGKALRAWLSVAIMGALDEFAQSFFPYRNAAVGDWAVDVAASFFTVFLLWIFSLKNTPTDSLQHDKKVGGE